MAKPAKKLYKKYQTKSPKLQLLKRKKVRRKLAAETHRLTKRFVCETDRRGHTRPDNRSPLELVVDASEGFVPLWAANSTLRWKFNESSMQVWANSEEIKTYIRTLFGIAVQAWGEAAPVRFTEKSDTWDFEIFLRSSNNCSLSGCTLASAFFPDGGRHGLYLYPVMFDQSPKEQVDTLIHEIGHVFGLRHFFAQISETAWASEIFGAHDKFTIMNYGELSELTDQDKADLTKLYHMAWSGELADVNGTPIRFMRPYHTAGLVEGCP